MAKYVFPAIFTADKEIGGYTVNFPDIPNCVTQGEEIADTFEAAQDALCLMLYDMEERGKAIPNPSNIATFSTDGYSFATLVSCDTLEYRRFFDKKAVKKTLTIPNWLNELAMKKNVNFSQILQNALMEELNVKNQ